MMGWEVGDTRGGLCCAHGLWQLVTHEWGWPGPDVASPRDRVSY